VTTTIATLPPAKASEARDRLLEAATKIFYTEGINTVGVDRIVSEASVTLATFYRHFPSKQDLVLAYLQKVHDAIEERQGAIAAAHEPRDVLQAIGTDIAEQIQRPGFRGCAFIGAASEFEDPESPVRRAVAAHRAWFLGTVRDAFVAAGHARPDAAAQHFVMLRDGAMVGGHLDDPEAAGATFQRGVEGLLRSGE
jgi:AcrR family transcriptional regulator